MTKAASRKHQRTEILKICLFLIAVIVVGIIGALHIYTRSIDQILYDERLSQMREVTSQLFAGLEDVIKHQSAEALDQTHFLQRENPATMDALLTYMQEQAAVCDMENKQLCLYAVDSDGRYYTQYGRMGLLDSMDYLASAPEQVSFVSNTLTTGKAHMIFLNKLTTPMTLQDDTRTVSLTYFGISQALEELNPYFSCDAYDGNNSVYILDMDGAKLFSSSRVKLLKGYNAYSLLRDMDYLHGSTFDAALRDLREQGAAYSNAVLDGTEYYYALYHMTNTEWTLLFLVPSAYVATNTVRLVNMTVQIILALALVLAIIVGLLITVMFNRQQRLSVEAERKNNASLAAANEQLAQANARLEEATVKLQASAEAAKTAFRAAEAASHAKSNFLSNMSHDIRTPMNAIMGITTLIDYNADSPEKVKEYVQKIQGSSQHLLGIINDVLDMSKIESGTTVLTNGTFNLTDVISQIDTVFRPQMDERKQRFTLIVQPITHPWLWGDSVRLTQILSNILSNAVKYTPMGGSIRMEVEEAPRPENTYNKLYFRIADNGIGMSPDFLEHIFESFTREESSVTNKVQGTGLGMAIVKNLVDLMGGVIQVDSQPGKGSCFEIMLEFKIAQAPKTVMTDAGDGDGSLHSLKGMKFLCAEDNELNAAILTELLKLEGASCTVCPDGQKVVEAFERSKPGDYDMILMDVQMPVMNGYEAVQAIRHGPNPLGRTIVILAMTANAFSEDIQRSLDAGMDGHLSKPIDMQRLKEIVQRFTKCGEAPRKDGTAL